MRRAILTIWMVVLVISCLTKAAENKYFYTSGDILQNEQWADVYVYNDGTIVNMSGGDVDGIAAFNASMVNISGGHGNNVNALDFSSINITGGYVYGLRGYGNSHVIFTGNAQSLSVGTLDYSNMIINGGKTDYLWASQNSVINLYSGTIYESLDAWDSSLINIYSNNFSYKPFDGKYGEGQLKGFYLDGSPLLIDLYDSQTYSHINFIPEPASFLIFGFGVYALRRR